MVQIQSEAGRHEELQFCRVVPCGVCPASVSGFQACCRDFMTMLSLRRAEVSQHVVHRCAFKFGVVVGRCW